MSNTDDDNNNSIQLRVSNQTVENFSIVEITLTAPGLHESINIDYSDLNAGDLIEYIELPATPDQLESYSIHTNVNHSRHIGWLNSSIDTSRTVDFTIGKFTYLLEYGDRDLTDYEVVQDSSSDDKIQIRVENISDHDFVETTVYIRDEDPFKRGKVEFGSLASGEFSEYITVDNALLYTEIMVITQDGEELDNTPLDHFSHDLSPGDYTYRVDIITNNRHDISRVIKD